ncbi:MAG TPA: hypothetical protein VLA16_23745 [Ideonella sp.]|nr:hypothetical protein [Ideonella sp.]
MTDVTLKTRSVTVSVDASQTITVSPDPVTVNGNNVLIVFGLATSGYKFPNSNAVVVTSPGAQFPYPVWTISNTQAALLDVNDETGDYKYTVNLVNIATGAPISLDPSIRNEG